ncbi:MFS transporter [Dactylosporangium sp. NBC_01737]|uniref:MFS transporter n=1 Tax=Dactylosporangium sp. NBC_01737 TaxID=2975959 RepID=UPI002E0F2525|nr:MFS transporter [Dactylosporangium sp. NBC_01737]
MTAAVHGGPQPVRDAGRARDFRLMWVGQATSNLGTSVTSVALPLVAITLLDATAFQVAALSAATWVPWLLIGLPAGAWVDRLPPRALMVCCDVVSLVLYLSVPLAAAAGVLSLAHLFAVAFGAGVAGVFFKTAYQVFLPCLLRPADLPAGNARLQGTEAITQIGGPGLAGLIAGVLGAVWALLFDAATFLVSALCLVTIRPTGRRRRVAARAPLRRQVADGIRFVGRDPFLRLFAWYGAVSNLGLVAYQSILVVFLVHDVGLGPAAVGAVVATMSLGGAIGAFVAPMVGRRFGTARATLVCQLVAMPSALLIPLTGPGPGLTAAVAGGVLIGTGVVAGNVIKGSWRQAYTPHHLLGRVVASMHLLNFGTMPLGALIGGALATWLGVRAAIWCAATWLALSCLLLLAGPLRRHRDLPDRPG